MRFHLLPSFLATALLGACSAPDDEAVDQPPTDSPPGHPHDVQAPELPRLPSKPLPYVRHGGTGQLERGVTETSNIVSGDRRITQRILLLGATGTEPSYLSAKAALDRLGVPHRALIASTEDLTATLLSDGVSRCNFNGVIVATSGLGFWNPSGGGGAGAWESAMTPAEWQELASFEAACSARELVWYGWPGAEFGLAPGPAFDSDTTVTARLTAEGQARFVRVKDAAVIKYQYSYGYRATIADPTTTKAIVVADGAGGVLVATHVSPDGRETMVSTVDSSPYLTHSIVLEYDFIRWVTRDLFVGKRRSYLTPQVDDLFLDNDMWVIGQGNQGTTQFRITGPDLRAYVAWQTARKASLPAGSTFVTDMAFNGVGTPAPSVGLLGELFPPTSDPLLNEARAAGTKLTWLNHTWDHENMDAMTRVEAQAEVADNCARAVALQLNGFTCADLVTPDVSGLGNANTLAGILDAGARFVVSDTSITEALRPGNPGTNPSFNVGRSNPINALMYHVPRHPTSVFYDVRSAATLRDEYNFIYRSYYGRDLSYDEIIDKDSEFGLYYMLQGDLDPLMFHQANLARYTDPAGRVRSVLGDWIDAVVTKYRLYTDAPILTLGLAETGAAMQARNALDTCGLTTTLVEAAGRRSLELAATNACTVPVTGLSAASSGAVETYAGEPCTSIILTPGQVRTVALP